MSAQPPIASAATASPKPEFAEKPSQSFRWSIAAMVIAMLAVGLALVPGIALDRPLLDPFAKPKPAEVAPASPPEREGGITLKLGKMSVNFGGKVPKPQPKPAEIDPVKVSTDPVRWFMIAAIAVGMIGLTITVFAQFRERHGVLNSCTAMACVAAITWQYLVTGLVLGIAILIVLLVISKAPEIFA